MLLGLVAGGSHTLNAASLRPDERTPILPLDDVRVGMKGYGLTVFAGATIEPFAVEVVSVMRDFTPLLSVIWIECPEPHMQHNGPVQGMSGSPIYLWRKGEAHDLGKGGGLIGAFAYGFSMVKTCYVGVQPIEQMRRVAQRAKDQPAEPQHALGSADLGRLLGTLRSAAASAGLGPQHTWRLQVLSDLYPPKTSRAPGPGLPPPPAEQTGLVMPMLLPFPVGSEQLGQVLRPLLNEVNLMPVAAGSRPHMAHRNPSETSMKPLTTQAVMPYYRRRLTRGRFSRGFSHRNGSPSGTALTDGDPVLGFWHRDHDRRTR